MNTCGCVCFVKRTCLCWPSPCAEGLENRIQVVQVQLFRLFLCFRCFRYFRHETRSKNTEANTRRKEKYARRGLTFLKRNGRLTMVKKGVSARRGDERRKLFVLSERTEGGALNTDRAREFSPELCRTGGGALRCSPQPSLLFSRCFTRLIDGSAMDGLFASSLLHLLQTPSDSAVGLGGTVSLPLSALFCCTVATQQHG